MTEKKILPGPWGLVLLFLLLPLMPLVANPFTGGGNPGAEGPSREESSGAPALALQEPGSSFIALPLPPLFLEWQRRFQTEMGAFLRSASETGGAAALGLLLLTAFLYGVFHSLLPGHQKILVTAYFLQEEARPIHALWTTLVFAVFHSLVSLAIVYGVYFFFSQGIGLGLDRAGHGTQLLSGLGVILLGIWFLSAKIRDLYNHFRERAGQNMAQQLGFTLQKKVQDVLPTMDFRRLLSFLFLASFLPCPGTILVLLFSLSLGTPFLGLLAVLAIALGMALTLGLLALLTIFLKTRVFSWAQGSGARLFKILAEATGALLLIGLSFLLLPLG